MVSLDSALISGCKGGRCGHRGVGLLLSSSSSRALGALPTMRGDSLPSLALRRPPLRTRRAFSTDAVSFVAVLVLCLPLTMQIEDLPRVELVVTNDTVWDLAVDVVDDGGSRMPLGTVGAERSRPISEVIVPGDTWRFRWTFTGQAISVTTVSDDDLERDGYRVAVPPAVARQLRADGAPPAP